MTILLRCLLALAVAVGAPRLRGLVLTLFSLSFVGIGASFLIASSGLPVAVFAGFLCAALFLAVLLPRLLPRIFVALLSVIALPLAPLAAHGAFGIGAAIVGLLLALFFSTRKPELIFRLDCAGLATLPLLGLFDSQHPLAIRIAAFAALFLVETVVRRTLWPVRPSQPLSSAKILPIAMALGAAGLLVILSLPFLAPTLPAPLASERPDLSPLPFLERRAAIARLAPRGGIIWPLPSEAVAWHEANLDRALFPYFTNLDARYLGARTQGLVTLPPAAGRSRWSALLGSISLHKPIAAARLLPDAAALERLRAAAQATVAGLRDILPLVKPGARESDLEAALKLAMRAHGCGPESFPLIFASGAEASAPHGTGDTGTLGAGELVVIDIGCQIDHYASDFTRTLPVSGTFTPRQKLLYENVFQAQAAALAQCKAGAELTSFGRGRASMEATAREVLKTRAPDGDAHMDHSLGHTVGLFVHDIFLSGALEPGNVITIEPGTYLPGELGIRIEDTFVVGASSCDRLTVGFPADTASTESLPEALPESTPRQQR